MDFVSRVGDMNGDGKDEFAVSIGDGAATMAANSADGVLDAHVTYVIEGRDDSWPSGTWDPRWGVELGTVDQDGVPIPLQAASAGDIDGDGFTDLLAMGTESLHLFYGGPDALDQPLTIDRSDAEILIGSDGQSVTIIGDVDGDGLDDFSLQQDNALSIVYGSPTRLTGRVQLKPDMQFLDKGPYFALFLADTNGDGLRDLIFTGNDEKRHIDSGFPPPQGSQRLYVAPGTGMRLTGEVEADKLFEPVGYPAPVALTSGEFYAGLAGDFDGDGSADLTLSSWNPMEPTETFVYLLPGSMQAPD